MPNRVDFPDNTQSLHNLGSYIMQYEALQNAFTTALVNRIGRVIATSKLWSNPWSRFKQGKLEYGEVVEEIFVNIAKVQSYDPQAAETAVFKRNIPDVRAAFHTMNYQKVYPVTISVAQLRQAFTSYGEMFSLISYIVDSLYNAMELDEYLVMKYAVCREIINGGIYPVTVSAITGNNADPENAIINFRDYTNKLTYFKTLYNRARVRTHTPIENQVIIMDTTVEAILGVKVLANAFNISEVEYLGQRIGIDSFTFDADDTARLAELFANDSNYTPFTTAQNNLLSSIVGLKLDEKWFMDFDNLTQMTDNYNGLGLYWNYFLHAWKTVSCSPFANAVVFTTSTSSITGVTVTPATANLTRGASLQMSAAVAGTGVYPKSVVWSIAPGANTTSLASDTMISPDDGVLTVSPNETVGAKITVTATAVDGTTTGTATITVV